jgi:mono/diheme cytochrome c family protein
MRYQTLAVAVATLALAGVPTLARADGATLYKNKCAMCHGENGKADTSAAKAMKAPALAGNAEIAGMSDADLITKIKANAKHASLKSVSDADLKTVVEYVKGMAKGK